MRQEVKTHLCMQKKKKKLIISLVFFRVLPAEAPEGEAQATVGVQTEGDLSGGVELTLELYGTAQGTGGSMRHLEETIKHTPSPKGTPTSTGSDSYLYATGEHSNFD